MSKTMGRRIRRSREEWQRLIEKQAGSGMTQAAFCAARGISVGSLQNWKRRLAASATTPQPASASASASASESWLELGTLADAKSTAWDIELDLGDGVCLRLRRC